MARQKTKICLSCSQLFRGRSDAQTCSERCRKRLYRAKQALVNDAKSVENSAEHVLQSAVGSIKSLESTLVAELLPVADTEAGFIGDTTTPTLQAPASVSLPPRPTPASMPPTPTPTPTPPPVSVPTAPAPLSPPLPPATPAIPMAKMAISGSLAPQARPTPAVTPRLTAVPRPASIPSPLPLPLPPTTAAVNDLQTSAQAHPPHVPPSAGSLVQPQAREVINPLTSTQPLDTTSLPASTASLPLATPTIPTPTSIPTPIQTSSIPSAWSASTPPQVFSLQSTPSPLATPPPPLNQPSQVPQQSVPQPVPSPGLPPLVPDTPKASWISWFKTRPYALAAGFVMLIAISTGAFALFNLLNSSTPSNTNISFQTTDNSVLSTDNSTLTLNLNTVIANGKTLTLGQLIADPTTGVLQLTGDFTASGTLGASGGDTFANNSGLVIDKITVCTSAGCIPNVNIPTVAGSTGTASGTAGAVALLNADQTFTGNNQFSSNSTAAFQIQNSAGTSNLLVANTVSSRIGIGTATPAYTLDVAGDINSTTGIRLNGALLCNAAGCTAAGGSNSYVQNGTALQSANFNIQSAGLTSVTGTIRATTSQTADLLQLKNEAAVNILTIGPTGNTIIKPSTNSINAFSVQNAAGTSLLIGGDTLNARVAIATAVPPNYTLDVGGDINTSTGLRVNGNLVCSTVCTPGSGSGSYIQNGTAVQTANFAIQSNVGTSVVAYIRGASGQAADLLDVVGIGAGNAVLPIATFGASGNILFQNAIDSPTAFQVQNLAGNNYLLVNTSGASISLGNTSIASTVQIGNTTGAVAQTINIGNNATAASATTLVLGSTIDTSSTTIQGGTGDILLSATNTAIGTSAVAANGVLTIGTDTQVASGGLYFGTDTNLYRSAANQLATNDALWLASDSTATAQIQLGAAADVRLYRGAANVLKTDDNFLVQTETDSTTAFQIQNAAGTSNLFVADTVANRIGIGIPNPAAPLDIYSTTRTATLLNLAVLTSVQAGGILLNAATVVNGGIGIALGTAGANTSGTLLSMGFVGSSAKGISINGSSTGTAAWTGTAIDVAMSRTYSTSNTTETGKYLNLARTNVNSSGTLTVTGALASFSSSFSGEGTTNDSSNILSLTQSYASNTGAVLAFANSGAGVDIQGTSSTWQVTKAGVATLAGGTIGSTSNTGTLTLGQSTDGETVSIANGTVATGLTNTINIGTSATGTGKNVIIIGSTNGASSTTIQGGTGNISINATAGTITLQTTTSGAINITPASVDGTNIVLGTSDTVGTLLVLDTKTGAGDPTGVNGGLYYNSSSTQLRGYINGAWNTIGGTNTGTTIPTTNLYDGRTFRLRAGSSPYDFVDLVYDATYAKWVSENSLLFGNIGTSGGAGDYDTLSVTNSTFTTRGTTVAYKNLYNAGLRLQIRQFGMFQSTSSSTFTTTYSIDLQNAPNFNSSDVRTVLSSDFVVASIGGLTNNTWYGRDSGWAQVAVDGTSRDQLAITWRWTSAGTQTMYANARIEARWVSQ